MDGDAGTLSGPPPAAALDGGGSISGMHRLELEEGRSPSPPPATAGDAEDEIDRSRALALAHAPLVASLRLGRRKSSVGLIEAASLAAISLPPDQLAASARRKSDAAALPPAAEGAGAHAVGTVVEMPDMLSLPYVGLYCHSLAMGLVGGAIITAATMCSYVYDGPDNLCANSWNIMTISWNFNVVLALLSEVWQPWGLRRKPFMCLGWGATLLLLLYLATAADGLTASSYVAMHVALQATVLVAAVAADGYYIELGKLEGEHVRGGVLATGMMIYLGAGIVSAAMQSLLLNGPATSPAACPPGWLGCWSWGLTLRGFYWLLFGIILLLTLPMCWLRELPRPDVPHRSPAEFLGDLWDVLKLKATFYLIVYSVGINAFASLLPVNAKTAIMNYVLRIPNLFSGIDTIFTSAASVLAVWVFERYLLHASWRLTNYISCLLFAALSLLWILTYHNAFGLRTGAFVIFIDVGQLFSYNLNDLLVRFVVVELARPGQEASLYELLSTVQSSAFTVGLFLAGMLTTPFGANVCSDGTPSDPCLPGVVDTDRFEETDGPRKFTNYTLAIVALSVAGTAIFSRFLPRGREECQAWKAQAPTGRAASLRAWLGLLLTVASAAAGVVLVVCVLVPRLACRPLLGGPGCDVQADGVGVI